MTEIHMQQGLTIMAFVFNSILLPLLGLVWWSLVGRIRALETTIRDMRERCITTDLFDARLGPIENHLRHLTNGGQVEDLRTQVIELRQKIKSAERRIEQLELIR